MKGRLSIYFIAIKRGTFLIEILNKLSYPSNHMLFILYCVGVEWNGHMG